MSGTAQRSASDAGCQCCCHPPRNSWDEEEKRAVRGPVGWSGHWRARDVPLKAASTWPTTMRPPPSSPHAPHRPSASSLASRPSSSPRGNLVTPPPPSFSDSDGSCRRIRRHPGSTEELTSNPHPAPHQLSSCRPQPMASPPPHRTTPQPASP
ncbi:LOW QUALITY PROTEIN: hypothetical protein SETIT_4G244900v2 [Setaria italica]|uniref:Uncharacterized protein n=1 Tax=Setaria italica TaxID=4555 RepID=A0A368QY65_SETIT|nr:LOW QUALITY PROTEIN: hypothetical protein SETIT_4G244900v2 [Setaria italica]